MSAITADKFINQGVRMRDFFISIWAYREYLKQSVARDLRKMYKRSVLGYFWSMLHPLGMMIILTIVFTNIMRNPVENYSVFLFSAMLPWQYFNRTLNESLGSIRGNMNIISQVPVPKYIFVVSSAFSNMANFLLALLPLALVTIVVGRAIPITVLALPIVMLPLFVFTMGVSLLFSVSNVFFEDTKHLSSVILQGAYFLCPVLYGREHLPDSLLRWLLLNPMFSIVEFNREIFYYGRLPDLTSYSIVLGGAVFVLALGLYTFHKSDDKFHYYV